LSSSIIFPHRNPVHSSPVSHGFHMPSTCPIYLLLDFVNRRKEYAEGKLIESFKYGTLDLLWWSDMRSCLCIIFWAKFSKRLSR
jgi:hypothetical protein